MKLKNKKTGEIINAMEIDLYTDAVYLKISKDGRYDSREYDSLAELCEEWEDYEEPKGIIDICLNTSFSGFWRVQIDYDNKEEAEKAVEKLKAWKRLKDNGLKITGYGEYAYDTKSTHHIDINIPLDYATNDEDRKDLDLLFGGEE